MIIKINENGYVESPYIRDATIEMEITDEQFEAISTFGFNTNWRYVDGEFVLESLMDDDSLRERRQRECFNIVDNRSQLWWNKLTDSQREEIETWYEAWLAVTETKIIPEKPLWLE
jgi:hypothetical protein